MQELIKKIEQWGFDRNLQTANPLIQTTKTLEEVIELQQAIINYEDEEQCIRVREKTNCCTEYQPTTSDGYCKLHECKYLTAIKDAIGDIFVTLVMLSIQVDDYRILIPSDKVKQYEVKTYKIIQAIFNDVFEIQQQIRKNDFNHNSSFILYQIIIMLDQIAENYNLTLKECVEYAYEQIKNRKGKMINSLWAKEEE